MEEGLNSNSNNIEGKEKEILVTELKKLRTESYTKDSSGFHSKIIKKVDELRTKYPDYKNYEMYHVLIGSSIPRGVIMKNFDFPDKEIERFLRSESTS